MNTDYNHKRSILNQNDRALDELYHNYASLYNLSHVSLCILYSVWDKDGCTQSEICKHWFFSRQTVNTALKTLEKQGYLCLEMIADNRKSKRIVFTEEGRNFARKVIEPLIAAENYVFSSLSEQEQELMLELIQRRTYLFRQGIEKMSNTLMEE